MDSWPQTRQFREREQTQGRPRTQIVRVREQSTTAFNPRQPARQQTVRIRELATASIIRKQASAQSTCYPQTVRSLALSTSTISPLTNIRREPRQAKNYPRRRITVSMSPSTSFPVHIQIIPTYDLI